MPSYSRSGQQTDRWLLAAYLDGLLDDEVAARIDRLVERDPAWAAEYVRQKRLRDLLAAAPAPALDPARDRVWQRLRVSTAGLHPRPLWQRRLQVPVPLVLGTAGLVLVLAFALAFTAAREGVGIMRVTTVPNGVKQVQIEAPVGDLQQLIRSLEADSSGRDVVINLPELPKVFSVGEPVLMRAGDLERSAGR